MKKVYAKDDTSNGIKIVLQRDSRSGTWSIKSHSQVDIPLAKLPKFKPIHLIPTKSIYNINGERFVELVNQAYEEEVFWRKNIFNLPSGKAGKESINLLTEWLKKFNCNSDSQGIALKFSMVLPILLLQKPFSSSKARDNSEALAKRIDNLKKGNLDQIISECKRIQRNMKKKKQSGNFSKAFAKLMMKGKVNAALRLLSDEQGNGVLQLNDDILQGLKEKHPFPMQIKADSLLNGPIQNLSNIKLDRAENRAVC